MLQQTRVATVLPRYARFFARYPTPARLAAASEDEVAREWEGLGYYRRARALRAAAARIARDGFPRTVEGLRALPGVGRYTAAAVAAIAFDRPEPPVDGNLERVLCRLDAVGDDPRVPAARARLEERLRAILAHGQPGALAQAFMDLGATVCTPRAPACGACPLARACRVRATGDAERYPRRRRRAARPTQDMVFLRIGAGDRVLLVRRGPGLLAGRWAMPGAARTGRRRAADVAAALLASLGIEGQVRACMARGVHEFTHRRWRWQAWDVEAREASAAAGRWFRKRELARVPLVAFHRPLLE